MQHILDKQGISGNISRSVGMPGGVFDEDIRQRGESLLEVYYIALEGNGVEEIHIALAGSLMKRVGVSFAPVDSLRRGDGFDDSSVEKRFQGEGSAGGEYDGIVLVGLLDILDTVFHQQIPMVDKGDVAAHLLNGRHVVGGEHDGGAPVVQPCDKFLKQSAVDRRGSRAAAHAQG